MSASEGLRVALVGPPNAGKTTLYNWLTGSRFRTVNYPGATVEYCEGETLSNYGDPVTVLDTPGLYSLFPKSPEEKVTVNALFSLHAVDGVICVVDGTQLSRHLLIVEQVKEAGFPVVVAVTMPDLLEEVGQKLDIHALSQQLGVPVVFVDGRLGGGVKDLVSQVRTLLRHRDFEMPREWSQEKTEATADRLSQLIGKVVAQSSEKKIGATSHRTEVLDKIFLHPIFGILSFLGIMGTLFSSIYWAATPLMDLVDGFFGNLAEVSATLFPWALLNGFLSDGLIAGVGAVLVFVPQIFILFLGLVFLEDWGYLSRAAAIVDRPLRAVGLNGRSFVPLLSGYACAIPAMMAARTIPNRRERLLTLAIIPLMQCSARLPVYALLLGFIFHGSAAWVPGLWLTAIYFGSVVLGALAAKLIGRWISKEEGSWFVLELPVYRTPRFWPVVSSAFRRTHMYIRRVGPTILTLSVVIWIGTTFPNFSLEDETERLSTSYAASVGHVMEPVMAPMGGDWRTGLGLVSAFAAREVFVSAMGVIFHISTEDEDSLQKGLLSTMSQAKKADGLPLFTTASIVGLIIFFMIALQCLSTVAVARREFGGWKMALIQLVGFNILGYALAVIAVQGLHFFGIA